MKIISGIAFGFALAKILTYSGLSVVDGVLVWIALSAVYIDLMERIDQLGKKA